jgi:hypothetical protein
MRRALMIMFQGRIWGLVVCVPVLAVALMARENTEVDLAQKSRVTASSEAENTKPENLTDGDIINTYWTPKNGTLPGDAWVELNWLSPVQFQEVVVRQGESRNLSHLVLETRDSGDHWHVLQTLGDSQHFLPRLVLAQFSDQKTTGLRLAGFSGRVSLMEIEVYAKTHPPVIEMGSDLLNHVIGIVTDGWGTQPFANVPVRLQDFAAGEPWQVSARTDENGMFRVDMPVGLEGEIVATAQIAQGVSTQRLIQAGDLAPGLSMEDESLPVVSLNGTWLFKPDPEPAFYRTDYSDHDWKSIRVPSHWMMEGFDSSNGIGGYRRHVEIPQSFRGRRIKLLFDGVYSGAEVWLNGKRVGSHEGGFSPFEVDITAAASIGGDNLLAVVVRENTLSAHLDNMSFYANFPLTGIFRKVTLFAVPKTHVQRFHVQTKFDATYRDATVIVDLSVENESASEARSTFLEFSLKSPRGQLVPLGSDRIALSLGPRSRLERRLEFRVSAPEHWEAEHPQLYTLSAHLHNLDGTDEIVSRRVGFRQVATRGTDLLINGVPVKLRGTNHYDFHPLLGRAVTPELTRQDLEMMKEANLDAIRTPTFPAVPELYDDADEMGFYVEDEAPFCWVEESADLRYLPTFVQRTAEMIERDRSHPSVIYWSVGNESTWGPNFDRAHEFVKKTDPTRPTSAAQSQTLDLATVHNPLSIARIQEQREVKVPVIWDESLGIFQGIWGDARELWRDPGYRDYYIAPLIPAWEALMESKNVHGSMIWAWVDDAFLVPGRDTEYGRGAIVTPLHALDGIYHMPGRGIVGDAPWGVVDGWRRKKPEFWHVKMLMSPVRIRERDLPGWKPSEPVTVTVDNRYEFTNLSELTLEWSASGKGGTVHPSIAPRSTGVVSIPVEAETKPGSELSLRFLDRKGGLILPYRMQLGTAPFVASEPTTNPAPLRHLHESSWLAGVFERFLGENFEIAFDGSSGRIRRALVNGHSVLYQTPKLHILPIEATLNEIPLFETWRLTKPLDIRQAGDDFEIVETGTFRDFAGEMRFRITPRGGLTVSYDFTLTGTDVRAREIGLQFGVPLWCDKLQWRRRGEWTVYPEDHIGRLDGIALAHAGAPQPVPPTQPYALDDTPLGTNDFRSTKRNFVFATLTDKEGYGIGIEAVGAQHLRASVDPEFIEVNVNDWFGGTAAVAWGEWWKNYGQGREIRPDDPNQGIAHNRLRGTMKLDLLSPERLPEWLHRLQVNSGVVNPE